jgi:hypothetical protein
METSGFRNLSQLYFIAFFQDCLRALRDHCFENRRNDEALEPFVLGSLDLIEMSHGKTCDEDKEEREEDMAEIATERDQRRPYASQPRFDLRAISAQIQTVEKKAREVEKRMTDVE